MCSSDLELNPAGVPFANGAPTNYSYGTKTSWQGSIRGRLGYSFGQALLYATGGVAFANMRTFYTSFGASQAFSDTRAGWTLGAGLEYALSRNWSIRAEYRYTDFGSFTDSPATAGAFWNGFNDRHSIKDQAVRVGVSYRF